MELSVISARLVRLLLDLDAARPSATCAIIASNAGDLEDIVVSEHALVRLSRLINSSNTCAFVRGVFDIHRMWYNIRRGGPLFPISIGTFFLSFFLFLTPDHGHSGATAQLSSNVSNGQHAY